MGKSTHTTDCKKAGKCDRGHVLIPNQPCSKCAAEHASTIVQAGLQSEGAPLDRDTRARMSSSFGFDFGSVRVHDGPQAARAADSLNASAYTVGRDIVLGERYAPGSAGGDRLLAHELAHVVQQGARDGKHEPLPIGKSDDPREREADSAARAAQAGAHAEIHRTTAAPMVQRQGKDTQGTAGAQGTAAAPVAKPINDDFENCSDANKKEIQDRSNDARQWVLDAAKAVRDIKAGIAKPAVKEQFTNHFRFDPADPKEKGRLQTVESSFAKMESGSHSKLKFSCVDTNTAAARTSTGFMSCSGHIEISKRFFEEDQPSMGTPSAKEIKHEKDHKTHILVHELAHHFANREGEVRPDATPQAGGCERQWPAWENLKPDDAINNAESYSRFAQQIQRVK